MEMRQNNKLRFNKDFFTDFLQLFLPFWRSEQKWRGLILLGLNIACLLGEVRLSVAINHFDKEFYDAVQTFNRQQIISSLWHYGIILLLFVFSMTYSIYFNRCLAIRWRAWLTKNYVNDWLANNRYYRLQFFNQQIDNPDQRISEDVEKFVFSSLSLFSLFIHSIITFITFGFILWHLGNNLQFHLNGYLISIPHYLFFSALLYSILGTYFTSVIGKKLPALDFQQQQFDASFRYNLVRSREASEQISLLRGEHVENTRLLDCFGAIVTNYKMVINVQRNIMFFSHCYKTLITIYGLILAMPLFLSKRILLGGVMQIISALKGVIGAFSLFVTSFSMIAEWRATIARISDFKRSLRGLGEMHSPIRISYFEGQELYVSQLSLNLPDGRLLLPEISFQFVPGISYLISGSASIGKSILIKAIAGLWPYGEGNILIPEDRKVMFLPQNSYLSHGTLLEILAYPDGHKPLKQCVMALQQVGLEQLIPYLQEYKNWDQELSLGEKQKINFVRILLQQPDFVFLDEADSALDEAVSIGLYKLLRQQLPLITIITFGHRQNLHDLHDVTFQFSKEEQRFVAVEPYDEMLLSSRSFTG